MGVIARTILASIVAVAALAFLPGCTSKSPDIPDFPPKHDEILAAVRTNLDALDSVGSIDQLYYQWTSGAFGPSGDSSIIIIDVTAVTDGSRSGNDVVAQIQEVVAPAIVTAEEDGRMSLRVKGIGAEPSSAQFTYDELATTYGLERN